MKRFACASVALGVLSVLASTAFVPGAAPTPPAAPPPAFPSPVALAALSDSAVLAALQGTRALARVDLDAGRVTQRWDLPLPPSGLALDAARARVYVTGDAPDGRLLRLNLRSGQLEASVPVGHSPTAPVLSGDGKTLYLCNRFSDTLRILDTASLRETGRIALKREPLAAALTPDGALLVVASHLPAMPATAEHVAAVVSLVETSSRRVTTVLLPHGSTSTRGVCVSPDGKYAYVTHTLARFQLPTTQLERGWMNTSAVSIIDLAARRLLTAVLLDGVKEGAANPWGVVGSADGARLYVAHAGTHEVSVLDRPGLHARLDALARGAPADDFPATLDEVPTDLCFLVGLRQRLRLPGNGPRALALAGTRLVAGQYFSDDLAVIAQEKAGGAAPRSLPLGPALPPTPERLGEQYFNDARLCFQHWQSCASCHPDGRTDGLTWDLLNDGIGNPKSTRNMLHAHRMTPVMSLGRRGTAEKAVRSGLRTILLAVPSEEVAVPMDAYLKALTPIPSPRLLEGRLSPAAERGKLVFHKTDCVRCHAGSLGTDGKSHDVGTGQAMDRSQSFVTPRLTEIWRTAPYLHDGSAATPGDAFSRCGGKQAADLSAAEKADLIEYLLSL